MDSLISNSSGLPLFRFTIGQKRLIIKRLEDLLSTYDTAVLSVSKKGLNQLEEGSGGDIF